MKNKESSRKYQGEKYQGKHEKHKKKRISRSDLKNPLSYFFRAFREFRVWGTLPSFLCVSAVLLCFQW